MEEKKQDREDEKIGIIVEDLKFFEVTNTGRFVSHYFGQVVAICEWFGDWGKDIYTEMFFHKREIKIIEGY